MLYLNNLETEIRCGYEVSSKMKRVWNIEIECLEEIKRICKKYDVTYYAIAGTLLGAVRHKGFIPWDNDIDLGMPRKDYEKFMEVAARELKEPYFMQTYKTERRFSFDMIKIRNSNTTAFTPMEEINDLHKGIFIDIFPIDNEPDDDYVRRQENKKHVDQLRNIDRVTRKWLTNKCGIKKIVVLTIKAIARFLVSQKTKEIFMEYVINDVKKYNSQDTEYCGMRSFSFPDKFRWKNKDCEKIIEIPFENTTIAVPENYDNILKSIYGNYHEFVRGGSCHEGTVFDPDTPFMNYKQKRTHNVI